MKNLVYNTKSRLALIATLLFATLNVWGALLPVTNVETQGASFKVYMPYLGTTYSSERTNWTWVKTGGTGTISVAEAVPQDVNASYVYVTLTTNPQATTGLNIFTLTESLTGDYIVITADGTTITYGAGTPDVNITSVTGGNHQLNVKWSVTGFTPTSQTIQYKSGSGSYQNGPSVAANATEATITGLTNGTLYTVKVTASNSTNTEYDESTGTPATQVQIPVIIDGTNKTRQDAAQIFVYIDGYPSVTYPQNKSVYSYETVSGSAIKALQDAAAGYLYFTLNDAVTSNERSYKISCSTNNSCVKLTFAPGVMVPTASSCAAAPASHLPVVRIGKKPTVAGNTATINLQMADWGCADVESVKIYYTKSLTDPITTSSDYWTIDLTQSPYTAISSNINFDVAKSDGLTPGTYRIKVAAINASGEGALSDETSFDAACTQPTAAQFNFTNTTTDYTGALQAPSISAKSAEAGSVTNVYYNGTVASGKTDAGTYAISIDANAGTKYCAASQLALGKFVINPATPTAADFTYSIPANKTFDDAYAKATVSAKSGVSGMGAVTVKYNGATAADGVKNAGTYAVTFDVAAGTNYTSATGLVPTPTSSFTISKAAGSITITNDVTTFCQSATTPTVTSTRSGDGTVSYSITAGTDKADINASTGVLTYKAPGTFTVRATVAEGTNHLTASADKEFTFDQAPSAGTLSADVAVCSGNSTTLTTTSSVGTLQWKSSTSASGTYSNVSGGSGATTASYTTAALTQTTYYKVEATNGVCSAALSATPVTVTVNANPTLTIDLTSSPGEGLVYEWEWATFEPNTTGTITAKSINRTTGTSSSKCVFGGEGNVLTVKAHPTGDVYQASYTATSNGCSTTVTKDVTVTKVIEVCP